MPTWSFWVLTILGATAAVALGAVVLFRWLYVKVPANLCFVRTGLGGRKAVTDGGAFVLPLVHNIQWLSLETFKIEIARKDREAFITKDRYRVDIGADFYLKVVPEARMIEAASRSLGEKSFSADQVKQLVEEKLVSAMRSAAAARELVELHENRRAFAVEVRDIVTEPLAQNGLGVEDVALFQLDQTDKNQLDPNNIFDAYGLRQITAETNARMQERNEIERNTEVAIRRKDVETVKLKLELEQEQEFATAQQAREIEKHRIEQQAETDRFRFDRDRHLREAEILKERAIREAELAREVEILARERDRELAEIERERTVEEARRGKEVAVLQEERKRILEEMERLRAEARREESEQEVRSVAERAAAEREKEVAVIRALNEVEVAERRALARERLAQASFKEGEAAARVAELARRAENVTEEKLLVRDVALRLIEHFPQIAKELMEPARHIDSIRVLDVNGLRAGADGDAAEAGDPIRRVYDALLGTGVALPLLRELLAFGRDSGVLERMEESMPEGVRESLQRLARRPAAASQ